MPPIRKPRKPRKSRKRKNVGKSRKRKRYRRTSIKNNMNGGGMKSASELVTYIIFNTNKGNEEKVNTATNELTNLLNDNSVNLNTTNNRGYTALMLAAQNGLDTVVTLLLAHERVNPNIADPVFGSTALILAAWNGDAAVVTRLLADKRVNPNISDTVGHTAPTIAA